MHELRAQFESRRESYLLWAKKQCDKMARERKVTPKKPLSPGYIAQVVGTIDRGVSVGAWGNVRFVMELLKKDGFDLSFVREPKPIGAASAIYKAKMSEVCEKREATKRRNSGLSFARFSGSVADGRHSQPRKSSQNTSPSSENK